ncbi:UNVERIFIED_CONTAM: hypothetical protein FKN15_002053 [Acipenser sinensis]
MVRISKDVVTMAKTYIGDILVAINPFKYLPLYEKTVSEKYKCHEKGYLPPHIFAVADRAYQSMLGRLATGHRNQCIVISGESGAGKTESTKLLLRQIMELCKANSQLEQQILQGQFGVQEEELVKCLICTTSVTRGESIKRNHSQQQAEDARDSIAKVAYGRVFGWIVSKINELLAPSVDLNEEHQEIGILDIFGFENFAVNRYEQLCINLANEQLQYFFNHHIFLMEQKEYKEEGITWETITFKDNKPILDLFLAKPFGIFSLLDEQSAFPKATDTNFVDKLNSNFKGKPHFEIVRSHNPMFTVVHYAGKVQYNASGFLEKNRDTIPANIRGLFINSVTPLLSVLFAATISRTGTLMPQRRAKLSQAVEDNFNSTRKQSVGTQFKHSLAVLMEKMFAANPHFIRCIKPNASKQPDLLDSKVVMDQLRYNGLLETIRIRRDGFSWRPSFEEFAQRYRILLIKPDIPLNKERKRKPQPRPRSIPAETLQPRLLPPVPRPRSKLLEATPFDNDLENGTVLHMNAQEEAEAKQRWNKRCNTIRWFKETQARKVVRNGAFPNWFHGMITRRQAEDLMTDKSLGCFLIRVSESREGYTLTFRGKDRCRHYMIEMQTNGKYVILGEARAHPSLLDLIEYHKTVGVLPFLELLTVPCGQRSNAEPDYEDLKNLMLIPSSLAAEKDSEPSEHSSSDPVHLELLKLFAPLDQNQTMERQVPPVLKRISEKKLKTEAKDHEESSNRRPFPRLYPSIRLAMREIQQVQQFLLVVLHIPPYSVLVMDDIMFMNETLTNLVTFSWNRPIFTILQTVQHDIRSLAKCEEIAQIKLFQIQIKQQIQ